ncbi:hypothetical protein [Cellulomonas hominis]
MGTQRTAPWVLGAVFATVIVLVGAWFLAVSPTLEAAATAQTQADDGRSRNDLLEIQVAALKEQFTHLDEYKAELATLQVQIPPNAQLAELVRTLQDTAITTGVTLTALSPTTAQEFIAPQAAAPAPAATDDATTTGDGTTDDGTTDDTTAAAPAAPATTSGFYAIPLSLTSIGTYDQTVAFLSALQTSMSRLVLITAVNAISQEDEGASAGRPATSKGDLETTVTGYAYVLLDPSAADTEPTDGPTTLPVPSGQRNPFVPVG